MSSLPVSEHRPISFSASSLGVGSVLFDWVIRRLISTARDITMWWSLKGSGAWTWVENSASWSSSVLSLPNYTALSNCHWSVLLCFHSPESSSSWLYHGPWTSSSVVCLRLSNSRRTDHRHLRRRGDRSISVAMCYKPNALLDFSGKARQLWPTASWEVQAQQSL